MTPGPARVTLVEDSATQALRLRGLLEEQGFEVRSCASAEEALDELGRAPPDLLVVDYHLPGLRGDELCRRIRMNIDTRRIPVLMFTNDETQAAELRGLESGADDYIPKSADPSVLLARLHALLRKAPGERAILGGVPAHFRQARLLAIDDSPTYLEMIAQELGQDGYAVEKARSGPEGLERLSRQDYDVVLLDLVMPGMDGIEVCRRIAELRLRRQAILVVLMLTARESREDMTRALEVGADDFVGKSSDMAVLKGRLRALLRRKFFEEENRRILGALKDKELEAVRSRLESEASRAKAALASKLELLAADLRRSNADLEQFAYAVSHDLRAPLRAIDGFSRVLLEEHAGRLDEEGHRLLGVVRANARRMAQLIDDLLDFSKVSRKELAATEIDMESLFRSVWAELSSRQAGPMPRLSLGALPAARGDLPMIRQVAANLLSNAVKYTSKKKDAFVEIGGGLEKGGCVYFVKDNGAGFDMRYVHKLFGVFQRLHSADEFEGTGVGLAIVSRVVTRHDGRVWAEGKVGEGACFRFTLPAAAAAAAPPRAAAAPGASP